VSHQAQHIEQWPIDKFVPYERNPRKNDAAVDRMCSSIREFGFKIPCLVRSDEERAFAPEGSAQARHH
jgi:ParB-like chromosome segregation protein Spo0J